MSYIRWRALLPLVIVLALIIGWTILFIDPAVRRGVEAGGTAAVGAKVDLASAKVGVFDGHVTLGGLQVTNPNKPMTNLVEIEEMVFDVGLLPALEKKIVIDTMAIRGMRFNTPRKTSGALPKSNGPPRPEEPSAVRKAVDDWLSQVKIPPLELSTLTQTVNVAGISAESLATLRAARSARDFADSAKTRFVSGLTALDPRPTVDSAEALANRLKDASLRTLGINGVRKAVADTRRTLKDLDALNDKLKQFETSTKADVRTIGQRVEAIPAARQQDYAYARSLLRLPTFEIPAIGPQIFSGVVAEKVGDVMYWVQMAERYVPPGLQRQMKPGPKRVRMDGTDVLFPKEKTYPTFLARLAELSLAIGGADEATGEYSARIVGATSQPAVFGQPTRFLVSRTAAAVGPRDVRIYGALDHRGAPVRDSLRASLRGVPLPTMPVAGLGATVALNEGLS
ncbi:MAG: TIGR03545 family protein, partial [Gemmatimonadaceae bacterium]|nr:TIGR03545 family protein [Gemmatimonadaceae bacterium]